MITSFMILLLTLPAFWGQLTPGNNVAASQTANRFITPTVLVQQPPDKAASQQLSPDTSEGAMEGVSLHRTAVYQTKGAPQVAELVWKSDLFFNSSKMTKYNQGALIGLADASAFFSFSEPVMAASTLFFKMRLVDGYLFAVDANTGRIRWNFKVASRTISVPAVAGETVYAGAGDGKFYAIDARTGREKWRLENKDRARGGAAPPVVSAGVVYFGGADGDFHAVEAETGKEKWVFPAQASLTSAAIAEDSIFVASDKGYLYALDVKSGAEKWNYRFKGEPGTPVYEDGVIYFKTLEGDLYAVDAKTAGQRWKAHIEDKRRPFPTTSAVNNGLSLALSAGTIYYAGVDRLYALAAKTGQQKWAFQTESPPRPPIIADGVVYIGGIGKLIALDAETGQQRGFLKGSEKVNGETIGQVLSSPAISNGILYFVSNDGHLYAMK